MVCQRLRETVSEIKKFAKNDPVPGAEEAVRLMEKLWPAWEHVESLIGALGLPPEADCGPHPDSEPLVILGAGAYTRPVHNQVAINTVVFYAN